jgi:stage II sporulation protein D
MVSPLKYRLSQIIILVVGFQFSLPVRQAGVVNCFAKSSLFIRVAIIQDSESVNLKVRGDYEITDAKEKVLSRGKNLKTTIATYKNGVLLGAIQSQSQKVFIKTASKDAVIIDGRKFSGSIQIIKKENNRILAINHIDLEDYVKGILYHEVSHYWPMEALKAQAIVSRSYAAYQIEVNKSKDFDVTSDIYSQVYGGRTSQRYRTNRAVEETYGLTLTYQDKIIPAYFHATCGGRTEDASLLWNIDMPPLKGVFCGFCKESVHFNWHYVLALEEIEGKLTKQGYKVDNIKDIEILGRDASRRIIDLKIVSAKRDLKISAKDFRNIIGPNIIRSTNFSVDIIKKDAVFEGFGWGHGVGLCQWGAYFMAKQGYTTSEILEYYYPGTDVKIIRF